ncbi:copper resistance CopC family protein [Microbacterium dauci]|uniref:Copper resistance protein CopC n=1 Tax=Microbacterium dauci TaxID=3048008 RepID=A0ABT6ZBB3_9MICO|nr:copper resistance CopC family protein [Microbacterium sp. LX3-4]MDJ1113451.1 copper resistance protein CopC [Microbacterium sp. LX3-4]
MGLTMRRLRAGLLGIALAAVAVVGVAAPASAHDELIGSTPASGEQLDAAPVEVVLTYSAAIATEGAAVTVVDAEGTEWAAGEHVIETNTLSFPLKADMPEAGYLIEWRVVSSDGHPISGTIPFAVGDAEPLTEAPTDATPTQPAGSDASLTLAITGIAFGVVVIGLVVILVLARRKRANGPANQD